MGTASRTRLRRMPQPAVDGMAEIGDRETRSRHPDRARVHGQAHCGRRHAVGSGQGRKDRLRAEQIDDRQEGDKADQEGAGEGRPTAAHRRGPGFHCGSS